MKLEYNKGNERDEAVKKAKKRKKARKTKQAAPILMLLFVILLITFAVLSLTVFFKTEDIKVEGSKTYTAQEIISCAEIKKGDNLFLLSKDKISERLETRLPFICGVELVRDFPSTVKLIIKETKEEVCFVNANGVFSADWSGKVIKKYSEIPENIVMITVSDEAVITEGKKINFENEREAELFGQFAQKCKEYEFKVDFINLTDPYSAYMKIDGRIVAKFGSSSYFDNKAAYLDACLSSVSNSATGVLDLSAWTPDNNKTVLTYCDISEYEK